MTLSIHSLAPGDDALARATLHMFGKAFGYAHPYGSAQPGRAYLERLLRSDTFIMLAARKGDEVAGGIAAYLLQKFEQERSEIYTTIWR